MAANSNELYPVTCMFETSSDREFETIVMTVRPSGREIDRPSSQSQTDVVNLVLVVIPKNCTSVFQLETRRFRRVRKKE